MNTRRRTEGSVQTEYLRFALQQYEEERSGGEHAWYMQVPNFSITHKPLRPERYGSQQELAKALARALRLAGRQLDSKNQNAANKLTELEQKWQDTALSDVPRQQLPWRKSSTGKMGLWRCQSEIARNRQ